jgi:hypothetical protein
MPLYMYSTVDIRTAEADRDGDVILLSDEARVHSDVDELFFAGDDTWGGEAGGSEEEGEGGDRELHVCGGELVTDLDDGVEDVDGADL